MLRSMVQDARTAEHIIILKLKWQRRRGESALSAWLLVSATGGYSGVPWSAGGFSPDLTRQAVLSCVLLRLSDAMRHHTRMLLAGVQLK